MVTFCVSQSSSALQSELEAKCLRVQQLEAYLGGELPKCGVSWREEKQLLLRRSKVRQQGVAKS